MAGDAVRVAAEVFELVRQAVREQGASRVHARLELRRSSRHIPIALPLTPVTERALRGIPLFVEAPDSPEAIVLCSERGATQAELDRLHARAVRIQTSDHARFAAQLREELDHLPGECDAGRARAQIIYQTAVAIVDQAFDAEDAADTASQMGGVAKAVASLVLRDSASFRHLFEVSSHDFYTATHVVNVATWMVALAHELGERDEDRLQLICQAGLLHDIGKLEIPPELLNKRDPLTPDEWRTMRAHPTVGHARLAAVQPALDPVIVRVALEHHERSDGRGYPRGLREDDIHPISRVCAVVDSFDAMTAQRPFRSHSLSVEEAARVLRSEAGVCYEKRVVTTWLHMLGSVEDVGPQSPSEHRRFPRFALRTEAEIELLQPHEGGWIATRLLQVKACDLSRAGVRLTTTEPVDVGAFVRLRMHNVSALGVREAYVVRCARLQNQEYDIGLDFVQLQA